jgi:hypothetical protein
MVNGNQRLNGAGDQSDGLTSFEAKPKLMYAPFLAYDGARI